MGLDIAFNRKAALDAGLVLEMVQNGSEGESCSDDPEFNAWLQETTECVHVPYCDHLVSNDGSVTDIIVRANKWGRTYEPLTQWLMLNNIPWTEF